MSPESKNHSNTDSDFSIRKDWVVGSLNERLERLMLDGSKNDYNKSLLGYVMSQLKENSRIAEDWFFDEICTELKRISEQNFNETDFKENSDVEKLIDKMKSTTMGENIILGDN